MVHYQFRSILFCLEAPTGAASTSDFQRVTCKRCLKNLLKRNPAGTILAQKISNRIRALP